MAGKKKKDKKKEKKENQTEQIPAVDRQFYELTITDLNNKLTRLRSHNTKLEEQNEEFELKIKQIDEDKADITSFLNRTLNEKLEVINELEDKLSELHKVREEEIIESQNKLKDWENKYKLMHDQLTSEIKLLNGKLNSLEEFRIQRDELMSKFDEQNEVLKNEQKKHKEILNQIEQTTIQDKDKLRKEVEQKLLDLSNEFNRTRDIRVAAHTQRLVRENLAITNEMDKMMITQKRLQEQYDKLIQSNAELKQQSEMDLVERKQLVNTSKSQLDIIEKLTSKYETISQKNSRLREIQKNYDKIRGNMIDYKLELDKLKLYVGELEKKSHTADENRIVTEFQINQYRMELDKLLRVFKHLRNTIKTTMMTKVSGKIPLADRENLMVNLLHILTGIDEPKLPVSVSMGDEKSVIYSLGSIGFVPKSIKFKALVKKHHRAHNKFKPIDKSLLKVESVEKMETPPIEPEKPIEITRFDSEPLIIDLDHGSTSDMIEQQTVAESEDRPEAGDGEYKDLKSQASDGKSTQRSVKSIDKDGDAEEEEHDPDNDVEDGGVSPDEYEM